MPSAAAVLTLNCYQLSAQKSTKSNLCGFKKSVCISSVTVFRFQLKKKDGQESFGRAPEGAEGRQRRRGRRRRPEQQEEREEGEARIFLNRF